MEIKSTAAKIQANLQELFEAKITSGDTYIRFRLNQNFLALLSMEQVEESLLVEAERITPLPGMPGSTVGIMSSRDRVFCVFDLAQTMKLPSTISTPRQYQVIVVRTQSENTNFIGSAVDRFLGMNRLAQEQMTASTNAFPKQLSSFLTGATSEESPIPILNLPQIITAINTQN